MYKICLFVAIALFGVAIAEDVVPIVSQDMELNPDGHYHYSFESGNGIKAQQDGELKVFDKDVEAQVVSGGYEYTGDDGQVYAVKYTADENGFHPEGAHLPVAPAVPAAILRALEYIAAHPSKE